MIILATLQSNRFFPLQENRKFKALECAAATKQTTDHSRTLLSDADNAPLGSNFEETSDAIEVIQQRRSGNSDTVKRDLQHHWFGIALDLLWWAL